MLSFRMMFFLLLCTLFSTSINLFAQHDPFKGVSATEVLPLAALPKEKFDTNMVVDVTDIEALFQKQNENAEHILEISPMILNALQQDDSYNKTLYILDLRGEKAYNVSHIENAKFIDITTFSVETVWALSKKGVVILYSLQGENVAEIGAMLRKFGFESIFKLEGDFLEWANNGYIMKDKDDQPTTQVYLPNKSLNKSLKKGKAVF